MMDKTFNVNQKVSTPIGPGTVQGKYQDGKYIVRLPINAETTKRKGSLTPKAGKSGLWTFSAEELK